MPESALTPEQWREWFSDESVGVSRGFIQEGEGFDGNGTRVARGLIPDGVFGGADRQALAALALHGQSFGFTWKDVDALHGAADYIISTGNWLPIGEDHQRRAQGLRVRSLAGRIAALLPPRAYPEGGRGVESLGEVEP